MPLRFLTSLVLATLLIAAAPAPVFAQADTSAQTAAAQPLVDDFIRAVNGDAAARADFLKRRVSATPRMPKAEFPGLLDGIARTSGGLKATSWQLRGRIRVTVVAANGKVARVDLAQDPSDPTKLAGMIAVATPASYAGPKAEAGLSEDQLAAAIERRVRFSADRDDFSGAVLVMRGDQVIYSGLFGEADKAVHTPITLETRFNLGSMGKQFTAVAIGQMIEQGKLTLDSRLIDVLPDYPNAEAARKITIRQLLSHQAGLGMLFERKGWDWKLRYETMGELLPLFAREPLAFEPGSRADYSNEGFIVLGAVVEKLSGQSWYDYVQTNVFDRAGMTHTGSLSDDPAIPDRAVGYKFAEDDPLGFGPRQANWDTLSRRGNSCGGQYSTVGDMIRFLQALRSGKLLKPETVALFVSHPNGGLAGYGLGFQHVDLANGRALVGHDGGGPGSGINSDAKMIWETGYAYAVLGNYDAPFAQSVGRDIGELLALQG